MGEVVDNDGARGLFFGNRGCLHDDGGTVVRHHRGRRWITCRLVFKDWHHPPFAPRRYTGLFFLDEATALAAGHRPCAECRRHDFEAYRAAWGGAPGADAMDAVLHAERVRGRGEKVVSKAPWRGLPDGVVAIVQEAPRLLWRGGLRRWTSGGYAGDVLPVPRAGDATVLTPPSSVRVLASGYEPVVHPSVK
jgi:hypothetical protein